MQSMEDIYREHSQTVYKYLLTLTHDADLSEELTQETFYQAIKSSGRFDGSCKISTWLCAIAKRQLAAYRRKHPACEDIDAAAGVSVSDDPGDVELLRMLHAIDDPYREVMYLRLFGSLSFSQIGDILGKTENWARVAYYRGKEKLKKELDKNE